jgi:hypothetical protein
MEALRASETGGRRAVVTGTHLPCAKIGDLVTSCAASDIREYCAERFLIPLGFSVVKMNAVERPVHCQLNWAILLCDVIPDGKTE